MGQLPVAVERFVVGPGRHLDETMRSIIAVVPKDRFGTRKKTANSV
jgi:hypothetical protein